MNNRLKLQKMLEELLGSSYVYFQPPEGIKMNYPAIVYSLNDIVNKSANNRVYIQNNSYVIKVIDKNPDSLIVDKISKLPKCIYDRSYKSEGLNHTIFTLYF